MTRHWMSDIRLSTVLRLIWAIIRGRVGAVTWRGTMAKGGMVVLCFRPVEHECSRHFGDGRTTHDLSDGTFIEVKS